MPQQVPIRFDLGPGIHTIGLLSALPIITDSVDLDGSLPGSSPGIELVGAGLPGVILPPVDNAFPRTAGLHIAAFDCVIRGMIINRFSHAGILIDGGGGHVIAGNHLGTDASGTVALGNGFPFTEFPYSGVNVANSSNNRIGGDVAADRNVISGNGFGVTIEAFAGSFLVGSPAPAIDNVIAGNYIGTDATGSSGLGNFIFGVLHIETEDLVIEGNVVSGNGLTSGPCPLGCASAIVGDANPLRTIIADNLIGTDASGTTLIGNGRTGIDSSGTGFLVRGNVIAGGGRHGIEAVSAVDWIIENNIIGSDINKSQDFGNGQTGIVFAAPGSSNNIVRDNFVANNFAGGIILFVTEGNLIEGNTVVLNGDIGIFAGQGANSLTIIGNLIGTDATGADLGNAGAGVVFGTITALESDLLPGFPPPLVELIFEGTIGPTVGPIDGVIGGNVIAHNAGPGVLVGSDLDDVVSDFLGEPFDNGADGTSLRISILSNSIFNNDELGVDLTIAGAVGPSSSDLITTGAGPVSDGVTGNDIDDPDQGANNLQNFPVLTEGEVVGSGNHLKKVEGVLDSAPGDYRIEFFVNENDDPSAHGEGEKFAGFIEFTIPASPPAGGQPFSLVCNGVDLENGCPKVDAPSPLQHLNLTSTATNLGTGSTSEFSLNVPIDSH